MNSGTKRLLDLFAYSVSGVALVGAAWYGLQHTITAQQPIAVTTVTSATAPPATPDQPAQVATATPPPSPVPPQQPMAQPIPAQPAIGVQDRATFFALQRNCYDAAANNQNGEYPALQASACNRYTQFANERGWDPGSLPAYGQPLPPPPPRDYAEAPATVAEPQVIVVQQPVWVDRGREFPAHSSTPPPTISMRMNHPDTSNIHTPAALRAARPGWAGSACNGLVKRICARRNPADNRNAVITDSAYYFRRKIFGRGDRIRNCIPLPQAKGPYAFCCY